MTRPLALVTGGVKRVGAAIAGRLADAGYALALHGNSDIIPEDGLAKKLQETGCDWSGFQQNFLEDGAAESLIEHVAGHFGRVPDLIVNSASIFGQDMADEVEERELLDHYRVNSLVPVLLTTALHRRRPAGSDRACVIHILDQRIRNPNRDQLSYTLSKQALAGSVRSLAVACADRLRVNGVAPGLTLTAGEYGQDQLAKITAMMPLDRLPEPDDIADAVLYLAQAEAVTGQIIYVDAGANLKSFDRDFVHLGKA
ncbi:SDR family oxidoreductase [Parasphingorhabdus flavimaris]|uniref:SDR family oxidoreductase n=1 Tax=Parasphingorhabdus flavimaris TaxID=266812 RepID=A0ABX2N429_9SPHN|nr:SDR family oxidoreductase [Parasphingorhabdus flavimaris]NVD28458.1 SDR family oxidoreductase [Parasphingorhabdus flavimaris]|tara:strand:+ start:10551 stop:11318 length:768 start_codon:yes stop_codon:yes gene_type:complete